MKFLSLFSGIEAATVAWAPLGWDCVGVAEIEKFPAAVLAHHYPDVPNLGDVTKITKQDVERLGPIDLVCGGFPCQDLSVAGQRKGLKNVDGSSTRSGLFFDAMRIAEWANPRWLFIENVPGMFSSNQGRDFASVVGEMAGCEFDVPREGWRNAGVVAGPKGLVEWTVLDAQYHGLAQRRKRVFLVRDSGDWANRAPLFLEQYRLCGHTAPSRKARQGTAVSPAISVALRGREGDDAANCLRASKGGGDKPHVLAFGGNQTSGPRSVSSALSALSAHGGTGRMDFETETFVVGSICKDSFTGGAGGRPDGAAAGHFIPFDTTQITSATNGSNPQAGDPCHPLAAGAHAPALDYTTKMHNTKSNNAGKIFEERSTGLDANSPPPALLTAMQVRRLLPVECARLQGFPDDYLDINFRGKPAADGPKYRALGNSWAIPVVAWVGRRIANHLKEKQ